MHNYASLHEYPDPEEQAIPHHHVSEPTRSRWNHIDNLDSFFIRVYKYHQKHGFWCLTVTEIVKLHKFVFVCGLTLSLLYAVDYGKLFNTNPSQKHQTIFDVLLPFHEVMTNMPLIGWLLLLFLSLLFLLSCVRKLYAIITYWDIKQFYNQALHISDDELDNMTWHDVQAKLKQAQLELQMCIHKRELTELDIYHRILRQTNYLVALVNKKLLPPREDFPFLGEIVYWTKGVRINIMFLLFWSPWSLFENPWHLKEEYKRAGQREKLATKLGHHVLWLFLVNVLASPLIFVGQIIFYFFSYFDLIRREPGKFGVRYWSQFGRLYLRHFNELDHELHSRLTRAYKPATKYLDSFNSPLMVVIAQHMAFICSSLLAILVTLGFLDNEILYWDQVLTILAILTAIITVCRSVVPDDTLFLCPESLLQAVVLHTHYFTGDWQGIAHTIPVKTRFQQLFQYRFAALLEEFLSPLLTPYFLLRYVYPRSLDLVDFFRNFTVSVVGVGDVCSFAQMDIRRHGNPDWQPEDTSASMEPTDQYSQAEDGKVELSLMHFTATNPEWDPPRDVRGFVDSVNDEVRDYELFDLGVMSSMELDARSLPIFRTSSIGLPALPSKSNLARKSMFNWKAEGPDFFTGASNMRASTLVLHTQHANKVSNHRYPQPAAQETTPLLFNK
ncbi:autophagy-related protein 9A [Sitophilus oryzae]|uniref:Autophagy-related protein 9 n=1 Tax=Sitophilus oryzae TaxID=7048 RepID=A0A6J2XDD9_SITOR|nr:autophagy-related protein 9A [Sitophilus oryzae]